MKNNLPKEGWYVKNDGSQLFKDTFKDYKPFVGWNLATKNCFYGVDSNGKAFFETIIMENKSCKRITLDDFIELSKPIEDTNDIIDGFLLSIQPIVDKVKNSFIGDPDEAVKFTKGFEEMVMKIREAKFAFIKLPTESPTVQRGDEKITITLEDTGEQFSRIFNAEDYTLHSNEQVVEILNGFGSYWGIKSHAPLGKALKDYAQSKGLVKSDRETITLEDTGDFKTINMTDAPCGVLMTGDAVCELFEEFMNEECCFEEQKYYFDKHTIPFFLKNKGLLKQEDKTGALTNIKAGDGEMESIRPSLEVGWYIVGNRLSDNYFAYVDELDRISARNFITDNGNWSEHRGSFDRIIRLMTNDEILEALRPEAKKRGHNYNQYKWDEQKYCFMGTNATNTMVGLGVEAWVTLLDIKGVWVIKEEQPDKPEPFQLEIVNTRTSTTKITLEGSFIMPKERILDALKNETLICNEIEYEVPYKQFTELLMNEKFGLVELELTEVKK